MLHERLAQPVRLFKEAEECHRERRDVLDPRCDGEVIGRFLDAASAQHELGDFESPRRIRHSFGIEMDPVAWEAPGNPPVLLRLADEEGCVPMHQLDDHRNAPIRIDGVRRPSTLGDHPGIHVTGGLHVHNAAARCDRGAS